MQAGRQADGDPRPPDEGPDELKIVVKSADVLGAVLLMVVGKYI